LNDVEKNKRRGLMLVLSSPSGAGKSTISRELLKRTGNLAMSISATTRPPRPGEENGKDYLFINKDKFNGMVTENEFLEHAEVFDNFYGTPKKPVEMALARGQDVLFDVDWQGERQLKQNAADDVVSIFILPPSQAELERRLHTRAQDSEEVVRKRMAKAFAEISHWKDYDYIVINEVVEDSVAQIQAILTAERLKQGRQTGLADFVRALRESR
jgi:guanylate kinase